LLLFPAADGYGKPDYGNAPSEVGDILLNRDSSF
jgi:hypothetical protein